MLNTLMATGAVYRPVGGITGSGASVRIVADKGCFWMIERRQKPK